MEFAARLESLPEMLSFIKENCIRFGLAKKSINKVELASEEAIVNIISYAYPHSLGKICITFEQKEESIEIVLRDRGIPFNPLQIEADAEVKKPLHERKIGGLGIFLIEKLMDEVRYSRECDENVLSLIIHCP